MITTLFLLLSLVPLGGQEATEPLARATVRFELRPAQLLLASNVVVELVELGSDDLLGSRVDLDRADLKGGVFSFEVTGAEVDGREVFLRARCISSLGLGLGLGRSEVFALREGESAVQVLRFPEFGLVEIEIPKYVTVDGVRTSLAPKNRFYANWCFPQATGDRAKVGSASSFRRAVLMDHTVEHDFASVARTLRASDIGGVTFETKDSWIWLLGAIPAGELVVRVESEYGWVSEPMRFEMQANALTRRPMAPATKVSKLALDLEYSGFDSLVTLYVWSRSTPFPFLRIEANFGKEGAEDFLQISPHDRELMFAGWRTSKSDPGSFEIRFVKIPLTLPGDPSTESDPRQDGSGQILDQAKIQWPLVTSKPCIELTAVKSEMGYCNLSIQSLDDDPESGTLFPLEGYSNIAPTSRCIIYGLPPGTYRISRHSVSKPFALLDQQTLAIQ
jgi:hypothetical protein